RHRPYGIAARVFEYELSLRDIVRLLEIVVELAADDQPVVLIDESVAGDGLEGRRGTVIIAKLDIGPAERQLALLIRISGDVSRDRSRQDGRRLRRPQIRIAEII